MSSKAPVKRRASNEIAAAATAEQSFKVLDLLKSSTSFELKHMVSDEGQRAALKRLGFDPVEAEPRQVYFFDTPDLALSKAGLVVRARRSKGGKADTVVKLRPVDPVTLDPALRRMQGFKVEVDVMPGGYVCSASMKGVCTSAEVLDVNDGKVSIRSIFSKAQRAFYAANAPPGIEMNALAILGPTFQLRIKQIPKDFDRRIVVELWLYPDGSRIFEISTKGLPDEAFQLAMMFRAFMAKCEIPIERHEGTKTSSALKFFSKDLRQALPA